MPYNATQEEEGDPSPAHRRALLSKRTDAREVCGVELELSELKEGEAVRMLAGKKPTVVMNHGIVVAVLAAGIAPSSLGGALSKYNASVKSAPPGKCPALLAKNPKAAVEFRECSRRQGMVRASVKVPGRDLETGGTKGPNRFAARQGLPTQMVRWGWGQ